jgi:hypothetical protein
MRRRAGTLAALGAALCGTLPVLFGDSLILFSLGIASIAVLWLSAIVLVLHDKSSSRVWKRLVAMAGSLDVELVAIGLGLFSTGLGMLVVGLSTSSAWIWVGVIMVLLGGFFIGGQIGKGIGQMIRYRRGRNVMRTASPVQGKD